MNRTDLLRAAALVMGMFATAQPPVCADPLYTVTDLGPRYVTGLNNSGDAVGQDPSGRPFLYRDGTFTDLSGVLGTGPAWAVGINDSGQIAGSMTTTDGGRGFVLNPDGHVTTFQPTDGGASSRVAAINNSGDVAISTGANAYFVRDGAWTLMNTAAFGGATLLPNALSDAGHVVGFIPANGVSQPFIYQPDPRAGQATWNFAYNGEARGVNSSRQIVGFYSPSASDPVYVKHAFLYEPGKLGGYQDGKLTDLGTLGGPRSWASALNALGVVVGGSDVTPGSLAGPFHAFVYQNGTMLDLNSLIPPASGVVLAQATNINDMGQIIGTGIGPDGETHSYLLTPHPIPEPSTLAFCGLVAAWAMHRRPRRA